MRAFLERLRPFAPLSLRLALGGLFLWYGGHKVFGGMDAFVKTVTDLHLPRWLAIAAAFSELVGGALLVLGFLARLAALGTTVAMAVALYVKIRAHATFTGGWDVPALCLAGTLSLLLSGAGRWSIDHKLFGLRFGE